MKRILQNGPLTPWLEQTLAAQYDLHALHKQADTTAFLHAQGASFEGLVTSARLGADRALMQALPNLRVISSFGVAYETGMPRSRARPRSATRLTSCDAAARGIALARERGIGYEAATWAAVAQCADSLGVPLLS